MLLFALGLALLSLVAANDNLVGFHPNDPDLSRDDERMKDLPDHVRDAKADKELKCSVCEVTVYEFWRATKELRASKTKKAKVSEVEYIEMMEDVCVYMPKVYALLMRNNKPTTEFSKDSRITRTAGSWITAMLNDSCGVMSGEYDEDWIEASAEYPELEDIQTHFCKNVFKRCAADYVFKPPVNEAEIPRTKAELFADDRNPLASKAKAEL